MSFHEECRPSLRGEIKKARHCQYDLLTCLLEFVDNALDTPAQHIQIELREKPESPYARQIMKVFISDDAPSGICHDRLSSIFSWTFDRNRQQHDIGEFGTGFKCAAVNMANTLRIITREEEENGKSHYWEAVADWGSMMERDCWTPMIHAISSQEYQVYHPFTQGTTFLLENLCYELFQVPRSSVYLADYMYQELAYHYQYYLKRYGNKTLILKGLFQEQDCTEKTLDISVFTTSLWFPFDHPSLQMESHIHVYQDQAQYLNFFISKPHGRMLEMVEFMETRKNGNHHLRCSEVSHRILLNMTFLEDVQMRSCYYRPSDTAEEEMPSMALGTVDLIYRYRVVGKNLTYRNPRSDSMTDYIKHELWLPSKFLFSLLGVSFNKKAVPIENEIRYVCEYLQMYHERELIRKGIEKFSGSKDIKTDIPPTKTITVADNVMTSANHPNNSGSMERCRVVPTDSPTSTSALTTAKGKRKPFPVQTKLEVFQGQICRDSEFGFLLKDSVLPFDYDHRDGRDNNSIENCQALSVLSHALKTRKPQVFEYYRQHKLEFIVQLLNCITSSDIFLEAYTQSNVKCKTKDEVIWSQGIFYYSSSP